MFILNDGENAVNTLNNVIDSINERFTIYVLADKKSGIIPDCLGAILHVNNKLMYVSYSDLYRVLKSQAIEEEPKVPVRKFKGDRDLKTWLLNMMTQKKCAFVIKEEDVF